MELFKTAISLFFLLAVLVIQFPENVSAGKILVLTPFGTKSHKHVFEPLIKELGRRGHKVTVVANVKSSGLGENVHEIIPMNFDEYISNFPNPFDQRKNKGLLSSFWDFEFIFRGCEKLFQKKDFQEVMSNNTYDLIIMNGFLNTCLVGHLYKLQPTPFVYLISMAAPNTITQRVGNWLPTSFVPNSFLPLSDRMNFFERTINTVMDWVFLICGKYLYVPRYEEIYRKYLGDDIPSIPEIEKNLSLIFMNSHVTTNTARPTLPDVVEVGGMHCGQEDSIQILSKDLDDFLSGADEHGFIYFSMGSVIKAKSMPETLRKTFVNVFSRLKQRILWKWDGEMDDLPKNVRIENWLPQQAILNHTNIKLFMSHGGLLSTQESIYYGVPVLGLPVGLDQDLNMNQMEHRKIGLTVEILDMTEEQLESTINRLVEEKQFTENAKYLSRAFREQPQTPLQRAIYWCEYVMKFNGAPHLRSSARELNFFVYYSMDVIAFLISMILVALTTLYLLLKLFFSIVKTLIFGNSKKKPLSGKNKQKKIN